MVYANNYNHCYARVLLIYVPSQGIFNCNLNQYLNKLQNFNFTYDMLQGILGFALVNPRDFPNESWICPNWVNWHSAHPLLIQYLLIFAVFPYLFNVIGWSV